MQLFHPAAALALTLAVAPSQAFAQSDAFERGRAARMVGNVNGAERAFLEVLRRDPQHYRALYGMGLVYQDRGVKAPAGAARLAHFRRAAQWLEKAYKSPKRASAGEHAWTIYNTTGLTYLLLGNMPRARAFLEAGYKHRDKLTPESRGKLYSNLGYLYALQGDRVRALRFFREASGLGSGFATRSLQALAQAGIN